MNISGGRASPIQREDLVLKVLQSCLMLLDQLRLKAGLAIWRDGDVDLALGAFELLAAAAIACVGGPFSSPSMLGVTWMHITLGLSTAWVVFETLQ